MEIVVWNVDTQNDFMKVDGALSVPNAQSIVGNLSRIIRQAEWLDFRILGSADEHTPRSAEFERNGGVFPDHCLSGTDGQLNIPETFLGQDKVGIARWHERYSTDELEGIFSKPQVILTKDDNDVFTNPSIPRLLRSVPKGATIYVVGVATEYCDACAVRGLARYSKEHGKEWNIAVVTDAIKEITGEGRDKALEEFRGLGASFVKTADVMARMLEVSRSNITKAALRRASEAGATRSGLRIRY
jgi:nicotinamidase/pyrazinamidase